MTRNTLPAVRSTAVGTGITFLILAWVLAWTARGNDAPAVVRFTTTDVGGTRVDVPEAGRSTILLFLLAGQPQSGQAIVSLRGTVGTAPDVRVVTVVGGSEAAGQVRQ